jgi:hypothetical protein
MPRAGCSRRSPPPPSSSAPPRACSGRPPASRHAGVTRCGRAARGYAGGPHRAAAVIAARRRWRGVRSAAHGACRYGGGGGGGRGSLFLAVRVRYGRADLVCEGTLQRQPSSAPRLHSRVSAVGLPAVQVHGAVSREPASWTAVTVEEGQLTEVIYQKANGEGIAKVWRRGGVAPSTRACMRVCARRSLTATTRVRVRLHRSPSTARSGATRSRRAQVRLAGRGAARRIAPLALTRAQLTPQSRRCRGAFATRATTRAWVWSS